MHWEYGRPVRLFSERRITLYTLVKLTHCPCFLLAGWTCSVVITGFTKNELFLSNVLSGSFFRPTLPCGEIRCAAPVRPLSQVTFHVLAFTLKKNAHVTCSIKKVINGNLAPYNRSRSTTYKSSWFPLVPWYKMLTSHCSLPVVNTSKDQNRFVSLSAIHSLPRSVVYPIRSRLKVYMSLCTRICLKIIKERCQQKTRKEKK